MSFKFPTLDDDKLREGESHTYEDVLRSGCTGRSSSVLRGYVRVVSISEGTLRSRWLLFRRETWERRQRIELNRIRTLDSSNNAEGLDCFLTNFWKCGVI